MSRRKHLEVLQRSIEAPEAGQQIVRAVGSRGSNLIEVEYPDGRTTLCLLPAKFHKKLWIKKGNFLFVEGMEDADARVTGQIVRVLFEDDVKALRRMAGVWPPEFEQPEASGRGASGKLADQLQELELQEGASRSGRDAEGGGVEEGDSGGGSDSESDDGLPPLQRINNRRVIEYEVSDSDEDED